MFDLNTIISNALIAAVQQAVAPLVEQIAKLEAQSADQHQRLRVLEGALTDRVVALETKLTEANLFTQTTNATITIDEARMVEALNSQEWFWEKLQNKIDASVEQSMDDHLQTYDHDSYDSAVSAFEDMPSLDDYVTRDEVRSEIEDVLNNATLSLSI